MLLICLQYFQASTSAAQAERQGQGEKEIDLLGIEERVREEERIGDPLPLFLSLSLTFHLTLSPTSLLSPSHLQLGKVAQHNVDGRPVQLGHNQQHRLDRLMEGNEDMRKGREALESIDSWVTR